MKPGIQAKFNKGIYEFNRMQNNYRPFVKLNAKLVRYHKEELLEQIEVLKAQIETNLEKKQAIKHLKNLILEREWYLSDYIDAARPIGPSMQRRAESEWRHRQTGYRS